MQWYNDTLRVVGNIGSAVAALTIDPASSINELPIGSVKICPNPTRDFINIESDKTSNFCTLYMII